MGRPNFDPVWLEKYDPICREIARLIFAQVGLRVVDGVKYKVDQLIYHDVDFVGVLELEYVSRKSGRFDHKHYHSPVEKGVSIPGRKAKFFWGTNGWWMNFSADLTHYIILPSEIVLANEPRSYKPYNNSIDESFYIVSENHPNTRPWTIPPDISNRAINKYNGRK